MANPDAHKATFMANGVPNPDPNKDWNILDKNWDYELPTTIQNLQQLDSIEHHLPIGNINYTALCAAIDNWLRKQSPEWWREYDASANKQILKKALFGHTSQFFPEITAIWGPAFNIPPMSDAFQTLLYCIAKIKVYGMKRSKSNQSTLLLPNQN